MQDKRIENLFAIHIRAVVALLVFNDVADVAAPDDGMTARDAAVIGQGHIVGCEAANGDLVFVQAIFFELPVGSSQDEPGRPLLRAWSNESRVVCAWWLVVLRLHTSLPPQSALLLNSLAAPPGWRRVGGPLFPCSMIILPYLTTGNCGLLDNLLLLWRRQ
jgi:hypothetical protein